MSRKELEIGDEWQTAESYAQLKNPWSQGP
jgi:hypothetical protein